MSRRFPRRILAPVLLAALPALASAASEDWIPSELGRPVVRNLPAREFIGSAQVWQITQDADGVIYFGNRPGLVTYDGATWRRLVIGGVTDACRAVIRAPDGRVYVAGEDFFGWLRPAAGRRLEFVSLVDDLPPALRRFGDVENIAPHAGLLYLNTQREILRFRPPAGPLESLPPAQRPWLHALHGDSGPHYAYERGGAFRRIEGDTATVLATDPRLTQSQLRFCPTLPDGSLLVVQESGDIWQLRDGQVRAWPHQQADFLRARHLARGWQLPDGTLALALLNGGLAFYAPDGRFLARLDEATGLRNNLVLSLCAASDGGVWLGLYNGAARLDWPLAWTLFDRASGLPTSQIRTLARADGRLYALTAEGVFGLLPAAGPDSPARFERLLADDYYAMLPTADGFAVVNPAGFVLEKSAAGFRHFPAPSAAGGHTLALLRSRRDPTLVWVGLANGLAALRATPDGWRDAGRVPAFAGSARSLAEAPDGRLWIGVPGRGVFRLTPGPADAVAAGAQVEAFPAGADGPAVSNVAALGDDLVFAAAEREGRVFRFDENARRFVPHPDFPALPAGVSLAGSVFGPGGTDRLWVRRTFQRDDEKSLYLLARHGAAAALPSAVSETIDDATAFLEEAGPDGPVLWVAGADGLLRVEVARAFPSAPPLRPLLWADQAALHDGATLAAAEAAALEFEFVAPSYRSAFPAQYQWRLVGDHDAWSPWSADRKRAFTHLREGAYRFELRARDSDGHLSAPVALAFTVLPPWWRTGWAYAGGGLLLLGAMGGVARLRTRALERKNARLEKIVATRTEDLRRQNGELARLHQLELDEKISARLAAEKAQLDVLRYQLNPHFLFNALTSIRAQIPPVLGSARDTLDRLADFCRLTLHGRRNEELTTIGEEIAMLRSYLDIEQTRLGELLSVTIEADPDLDAVPLPRLLLLPLVENALKYGQATSTDLLGLRLAARRGPAADEIVFEIANTGEWVERGTRPGIPSTGIGHDNLRERLRRHYPERHTFAHEVKDGWVLVRLAIRVTVLS